MGADFIGGAIKKPGALRETAQKKGIIKPGGALTMADIGKLEKSGDAKTKKRADLAKTLMNMHGGKK